ncbi:non-ribosomal peptide synthetase [Streptomyces sp. WM6368]|uniref:non-ribosomal peptide synthetase n=1 Tax=Streptomyces sp. WM6368 TaxID=1415554 RepID=UPI0006AF189A|nr:non-ribosomal peptide synthetase [Streptomyces sp. WM6368]
MNKQSAPQVGQAGRSALEERMLARRARRPSSGTPRPAVLPASFGQERMWLAEQFDTETPQENSVFLLRLRGRLDIDAMRRTVSELSRRHEVLRTVVRAEGSLTQVVLPHEEVALPVIDMPTGADPDAEAERFGRDQLARRFDLAAQPPVAWHVLRTAAEDHTLVLCMHHIVADGWSEGVLNRELSALYADFSAGNSPGLPELPMQYADFAMRQRTHMSGTTLERGLAYWRERLDGASPTTSLPLSRVRADNRNRPGQVRTALLPGDVVEAAQQVGAGEGASTFMTLMAAFAVLMWCGSGQQDFVLGTPVAGRDLPETETMLGVFINTLPLRVTVHPDDTFAAVLGRVRECFLNDLEFADVPFEKVVEAVRPERAPGRAPLVQVLFQLDNTEFEEPVLEGLAASYRQLFAEVSTLDLSLSLGRRGRDYTGIWRYRTDLLDETAMQLIEERYERILREVATRPHAPLRELDLRGERERNLLTTEWAAPTAPVPEVTYAQLFEEWARRRPDASAVEAAGERLTYGELNARANRLARVLQERGAGPEALIGIWIPRGIPALVARLAVSKTGAAYVPLDVQQPLPRLERTLEGVDLTALITDGTDGAPMYRMGTPVLSVQALEDQASGRSPEDLRTVIRGAHPAYVIFTSGSTGRPKGVVVPHHGLTNYLLHFRMTLFGDHGEGNGIPLADRSSVVSTSLAYDLAVTGLFLPLVSGGCVMLLAEGDEVEGLVAELSRERGHVGLLKVTPSLLEAVDTLLPTTVRPDLRALVVGGEPLDSELLIRWRRRSPGVRLINHYGPTEAVVGCVAYEFIHTEALEAGGVVPIGRPLTNTRVHILDAAGRPVPTGAIGELHIGGICVTRGYANSPGATAERYLPDPVEPGGRVYRTGDLVRYRSDGLLEFIGRADDQVKIRGHRVEPAEVAAVLMCHPSVSSAHVVANRDERGQQSLDAYVTPAGSAPLDTAPLRRYLADELPGHMVPRHVTVLASMPLTANGKVNRAALPALQPDTRHEVGPAAAPATLQEDLLRELFAQTLGLPSVPADGDFFELGGHSLLAAQLVGQIRSAFGVDIGLRQIFELPTPGRLARVLGDSGPVTVAAQ